MMSISLGSRFPRNIATNNTTFALAQAGYDMGLVKIDAPDDAIAIAISTRMLTVSVPLEM